MCGWGEGVRVVSIDTAEYPFGDRVEVWRQALAEHLVPFRFLPASGAVFRGRVRHSFLGSADVIVSTRTSGVNRRSEQMAARCGDRRAGLSLHLAGGDWVVNEDRSQQQIRPGDLVLWDLSRPMTLAWSSDSTGLSMPLSLETLVPRPERLFTAAATVLPTDGGLGGLIEGYLRQLARLAGDVPVDIAAQLGVTTMDLLATYLASLLGEKTSIDAVRRTQMQQAKAHIEAHLGEPDLCPATIAAAQYISVRLLYKLFAADGETVAGWIRKRRLERIRHDLLNPTYANLPIIAVASRWGFSNPAHFTRVFKATYNTSPGGYRRSCSYSATSTSPDRNSAL